MRRSARCRLVRAVDYFHTDWLEPGERMIEALHIDSKREAEGGENRGSGRGSEHYGMCPPGGDSADGGVMRSATTSRGAERPRTATVRRSRPDVPVPAAAAAATDTSNSPLAASLARRAVVLTVSPSAVKSLTTSLVAVEPTKASPVCTAAPTGMGPVELASGRPARDRSMRPALQAALV